METKNTDTIHALTVAEIVRIDAPFAERELQIQNKRAEIYSTSLKNGGAQSTPIIDDDEKAALQHAKHLLNGNAPNSLSLPPDITLDKQLYREWRGIKIARKIFADKTLVARATEAVEWAEAHGAQWRFLCRDTTLTAIKLDALERAAQEMIGQCPDIFAVRLPMGNKIGGRAISEIPISDLTDAALAEGVVSHAEIRKAKHVE
jgi:hypothetical protein